MNLDDHRRRGWTAEGAVVRTTTGTLRTMTCTRWSRRPSGPNGPPHVTFTVTHPEAGVVMEAAAEIMDRIDGVTP